MSGNFDLNQAELESAAWIKIREKMQDRIREIHVKLETSSPSQTIELQGEAKAIRSILSMGKLRVTPTMTKDGFRSYPPKRELS